MFRDRERFRNAEVRDGRSSSRQQDVLRLDIAVNDSIRMRTRECAGDVDENRTGFRHRNRPALQSRSQGLAVDEWHREERQARGLPRGKNRDDVRVLEICGNRNLTLKSFY